MLTIEYLLVKGSNTKLVNLASKGLNKLLLKVFAKGFIIILSVRSRYSRILFSKC